MVTVVARGGARRGKSDTLGTSGGKRGKVKGREEVREKKREEE